jgi:hypothetical protein
MPYFCHLNPAFHHEKQKTAMTDLEREKFTATLKQYQKRFAKDKSD